MIDLLSKYTAAKVDPVTASYPQGEPKNVTVSGDGTGTPWEKAILKDIYGFFAAILNGATPSGNPETAVVSDLITSLDLRYALPLNYKAGLTATWNTISSMTWAKGEARSTDDSIDLKLSSSLQKTSATWAEGASVGGGAAGALMASTWYRVFLVKSTDATGGKVDIAFSTSATAADFLNVNANAIAAGFTDTTRYRRIGWVLENGANEFHRVTNSVDDPSRFVFKDAATSVVVNAPLSGPRQSVAFGFVPPNAIGRFSFIGLLTALGVTTENKVVVMEESQQESGAPVTMNIINNANFQVSNSVLADWQVNATQQLFYDVLTDDIETLTWDTIGWIDHGVVP